MTQHDAAPAISGVAGIEALTQPLPLGLWVWRVHLDVYARADTLTGLAPDEQARAARFIHEGDGKRFRAARHALRRILGACLECDPAAIAFTAGEFGKPRLAGDGALEFNLSHSAGDCLIAVSRERAVGIDVERVSLVRDIDALSRRHFTARERETVQQSTPDAAQRTFLACWTRKEACLKALGVGLNVQPAAVEVGCEETPRDVDVVIAGVSCTVALASLSLGDGAVGAVTLASKDDAERARSLLG